MPQFSYADPRGTDRPEAFKRLEKRIHALAGYENAIVGPDALRTKRIIIQPTPVDTTLADGTVIIAEIEEWAKDEENSATENS